MAVFLGSYESLISIPNLFFSWEQFKKKKRKSKELSIFHRHLEDNIFSLHEDLLHERYQHGPYQNFLVFDPKRREISKASVKDRLLHHLLYIYLVEKFDPSFIFHSFSCRKGKGTHQGVKTLKKMLRQVSKNGTRPTYALKMDILRFFDHVPHAPLKKLIQKKVQDPRILALIDQVIDSFKYSQTPKTPIGIPLGNVTSQIFANIYLHPLDLFVKHTLKKPYLRFCDDFLILGHDPQELKDLQIIIANYLETDLFLTLHPKKVTLRPTHQGIDFLGTIIFPKHTQIRTKTKRRMLKKLKQGYQAYCKEKLSQETMEQKLQSYLGILSHADEHTLSTALKNQYSIMYQENA